MHEEKESNNKAKIPLLLTPARVGGGAEGSAFSVVPKLSASIRCLGFFVIWIAFWIVLLFCPGLVGATVGDGRSVGAAAALVLF